MKRRIPVNMHTHIEPLVPGEAIVNCFPERFNPKRRGWYSVGIHPWYVTTAQDVYSIVAQGCFDIAVQHAQVLAVGEAGLDKLASAPMNEQIEVFEFQAQFAKSYDKPLIIHLVKALDELLKIKKKLRPKNPWIIHGFRGNAILAEEFLQHGFYLSFGDKYQEEALRIVPDDKLFLETDESVVPIDHIYERAAEIRGTTAKILRETIQRNVCKVFFKE